LSSICIIGLGTVGGFLAKNVSMLESTKKLVLIDCDAVLPHNIKNSIYEHNDIFDSKTTALKRKIKTDIEIQLIQKEYIEGETIIPKCDLVIDCRDVTYDRKGIIDARLYISYDTLIIDCKKDVCREEKYEGQYLERLTKTQINYATNAVAMLIEDGTLSQLIEKQKIHKIPIKSISHDARLELNKKDPDIIYDNNPVGKKLINLKEAYPEIIDINKKNDVVVYVGSKEKAIATKTYPIHKLKTINDIVDNFGSLMKPTQINFNFYVISVTNYNNEYYVEILPETGSA
jgi:hypothetical protein